MSERSKLSDISTSDSDDTALASAHFLDVRLDLFVDRVLHGDEKYGHEAGEGVRVSSLGSKGSVSSVCGIGLEGLRFAGVGLASACFGWTQRPTRTVAAVARLLRPDRG